MSNLKGEIKKGGGDLILTVDLNPIINRRYFISDFQCGKSYTAYDVQYRPGGGRP